MSRIRVAAALAATLAAGTYANAGGQVIPGTYDTFNGGTQGWFGGLGGVNANAPIVRDRLGRGGPDNPYLVLRSNGSDGPGGRLTAMNGAQWAGDYMAASIVGIGMWVNNFESTELFLRLAFEDPTTGAPQNLAFSTYAIHLPGRSGWTQIFFPIRPSDLTAGLGTVDGALANTTVLRLYHSQAANFPNPGAPTPVRAYLGVDDITAIVAPEPASLLLLATGGLGILAARRRRRRSP